MAVPVPWLRLKVDTIVLFNTCLAVTWSGRENAGAQVCVEMQTSWWIALNGNSCAMIAFAS